MWRTQHNDSDHCLRKALSLKKLLTPYFIFFLHFRKEMKVALILLVVNGTFILCWLPHFIGMMCLTFTNGLCPFPDSFFIITTTLAMLNSGCNPFIYTLTYRKFRKAFQRVLPCFRSDHTGNWETSVCWLSCFSRVSCSLWLLAPFSLEEKKQQQAELQLSQRNIFI